MSYRSSSSSSKGCLAFFFLIIGCIFVFVGVSTGDPFLVFNGLLLIFNNSSVQTLALTTTDWISGIFFFIGIGCLLTGILFFLKYQRAAKCLYKHMIIEYEPEKAESPEELASIKEWYGKKCNYKWRLNL